VPLTVIEYLLFWEQPEAQEYVAVLPEAVHVAPDAEPSQAVTVALGSFTVAFHTPPELTETFSVSVQVVPPPELAALHPEIDTSESASAD
jgi:hypothetical protein